MLQLALQIDLPAARPLIPVEACMVLCDADEDEILHSIEDGTLAFAFNVGDPGSARREIRVWRDALLKVLRRQDTTLPGTAAEVLATSRQPPGRGGADGVRHIGSDVTRHTLVVTDNLYESGVTFAVFLRNPLGSVTPSFRTNTQIRLFGKV